jgi:gentisate 1,2-dioxygenase
MPTIRAEMHRIRAGGQTLVSREVGSSVFQVFDGSGTATVGERTWNVERGDLLVVPSWVPFAVKASAATHLDLVRYGDAPIFEALHAHRVHVDR